MSGGTGTGEITMTDWIKIANLDDIPRLGARVLRTTDQVFALRDQCPHKGGPLSQGIVHGTTVTCPLHNWNIDLASGAAQGPDEGCAQSFPVKVEDGVVFLGFKVKEAAA
jgi:nitrite reductase (NADH) small subunit